MEQHKKGLILGSSKYLKINLNLYYNILKVCVILKFWSIVDRKWRKIYTEEHICNCKYGYVVVKDVNTFGEKFKLQKAPIICDNLCIKIE